MLENLGTSCNIIELYLKHILCNKNDAMPNTIIYNQISKHDTILSFNLLQV